MDSGFRGWTGGGLVLSPAQSWVRQCPPPAYRDNRGREEEGVECTQMWPCMCAWLQMWPCMCAWLVCVCVCVCVCVKDLHWREDSYEQNEQRFEGTAPSRDEEESDVQRLVPMRRGTDLDMGEHQWLNGALAQCLDHEKKERAHQQVAKDGRAACRREGCAMDHDQQRSQESQPTHRV